MSWIAENTLTWLQSLVIKVMRTGRVPRHVAIIMDGNRRYADKAGVKQIDGHDEGANKFAETLQWCLEFGIPEVTVYAFSKENFKRSEEEVGGLMGLAREKFRRVLGERDKLNEHGVCVRVIGNLSLVPQDIRVLMVRAMEATKDNKVIFVNIAVAYTSRDEITNTVKDLVRGVKNGDILIDDIDENLFSKCLYTHNSEDPDLLIRTSGEVRLSDFLMWQTSHACIYFSEVLWPEFSVWDFIKAIFCCQRQYYRDQVKINNERRKKPPVLNDRTIDFVDKLHNERKTMLKDSLTDSMKS